jgi:mannose-6-phosphate isomerase-like protein (cupin superfamily)
MFDDRDHPPEREDRYWDTAVRGEPPDVAIDPALAEAIARVHELDDAPAPDPSFVARLEDALVHPVVLAGSGGAARMPGPNGTAASLPPRSPALRIGPSDGATGRASRRRWALAQLATAALLVATLAAGYAAFRPRPDERGDHPAAATSGAGEAAMIPAPASWSSTLLLRAALKPVPEGSIGVRLDRWTFLPGAGEWQGTAPPLPQLLYVEAGRLTVTVDAAATLARATSVKRGAAVVPPDTPLGLRAGDLLVVPADARFALRPDGTEVPTLLVVVLTPPDDPGPSASVPSEVAVQALGTGTLAGLPGGPTVVMLRRLAVGPGTWIPPETTAGPELLVVEAGAVGLRAGTDAPEVTRTARDGGVVVAMGTRLALSNPSDDLLAVLRLTIVPAASGTGAPTT